MAQQVNTPIFQLTPFATAIAVIFTGTGNANAAPDDATLPEVKVAAPKIIENAYKTEKAQSTKYTVPLSDTSQSITVISEKLIQDTGSISMVDALRTVPGITFGAGEGGNPQGDRPFIRGYDSQGSTFVDGVRDSSSQSREIFNVEGIEVIKGSNSAFGGRGNAGGSINIVSKTPKTENFFAGSVGLGSDKYRRATIDTNYMLNDDIAFRLNAMTFGQDVPGRDEVDNKRWGFAPSITFGMNSKTKATISYYHLSTDDMPDSGIPYNNPFSAGANAFRNGDGSPESVNRKNFYGLTDRDFRKTSADIGTFNFSHEFNEKATIRNVTRYSRTTNDYILTQPDDSKGNTRLLGQVWRRANSRDSVATSVINQTDLFGELIIAGFKNNYSTGVEFSHEKSVNNPYIIRQAGAGFQNNIANGNVTTCNALLLANNDCTSLANPDPSDNFTGTITPSPVNTTVTTATKSAYLFDTIELNKQWIANAGIRYDHYSTESLTPAYRRAVPGAAAGGFGIGVGPNAIGATVARSDTEFDKGIFNYQLGLVFKPLPNGSIYASYGTSSRAPGSNVGEGQEDFALTAADLKIERTKSYELGTKWDILDNRAAFTAAIFRTETVNAVVANAVTGLGTVLDGEKRVDGLELGLSGKVTDYWNAFAGYTYLDSEITDPGSAAASQVNKGKEFPNTPKNSASIWTTYQILPNFSLGGGAFAVDKVYGNVANTKFVPGYTRFDAFANYVINKNLNLQLNVQNLTDKHYYSQAYASHFATPGAGRLAFLTLNFKF